MSKKNLSLLSKCQLHKLEVPDWVTPCGGVIPRDGLRAAHQGQDHIRMKQMRIPQCSLGIKSFSDIPDDSSAQPRSKSRMTAPKGYWSPKVITWLYEERGTHFLLSWGWNPGSPQQPLLEGHPGGYSYCPHLLHWCPNADITDRARWRQRQGHLVIRLRRPIPSMSLRETSTSTTWIDPHRKFIKELSPGLITTTVW